MRPEVTPASDRASPASLLLRALELLLQVSDRSLRLKFALAIVLVVAGSTLSATAPLALKALIDALSGAGANAISLLPPAVLGAAYVAALLGSRLLSEWRSLLSGHIEQGVVFRLSRHYFAQLLALPMSFHLERASGSLVQVLRQASAGCQMLLGTIVNSAGPVITELSLVMLVLLHLGQPTLVACLAASAVAYVLVCGFAAVRLRAQAGRVSQSSLHTYAILADTLGNIEPVKCFVAEPAREQRFASSAQRLLARWQSLHVSRAASGVAAGCVFGVSMGTTLALAADALGQGRLSLGGFVLISVYMLQLFRPLEMLGTAVRDVAQALEFIRPLSEILALPVETSPASKLAPQSPSIATTRQPASSTQAGTPCPASISLTDVHLSYPRGPVVLDGLTLTIPAGKTVAIVGPSGSGKSSILRLLLRLCTPQSGYILLDDEPIDTLPLPALRSTFGLVPQDTMLLHASIADNIAMGWSDATRQDIETAARLAGLGEFMQTLPHGLDTVVGERGARLSGGQRQRVAIARALLRQPRVLLLDEPTSMLDAHTGAAVMNDLRLASRGHTTLIVAHHLPCIQHADEIVVLAEGQVAERGSHSALLAANGTYSRLWQAQSIPAA